MRVISVSFVVSALVACTAAPRQDTLPVRYDDLEVGSLDEPAPIQRTVLLSTKTFAGPRSTPGGSAESIDERAPFDTRCHVDVDPDAPVTLSDDGKLIAAVSQGEIVISSTRTCEPVSKHRAGDTLIAIAFAGSGHALVALHHRELVWIAADNKVRRAGFAKTPTRWAIAPNGRTLVMGLREGGNTSSLAVWDLARMTMTREVPLTMVDREIDGLAFARGGRTAVLTVPVFGLAAAGGEYVQSHLAVEFDTETWRQERRVTLLATDAPHTLLVEGDTLIFDGAAFDWSGERLAFGAYVWRDSSAGTVAAVSTPHGVATWLRGSPLPTGGILPRFDFRDRTWTIHGVGRDRTLLFCTRTQCVPVRGP